VNKNWSFWDPQNPPKPTSFSATPHNPVGSLQRSPNRLAGGRGLADLPKNFIPSRPFGPWTLTLHALLERAARLLMHATLTTDWNSADVVPVLFACYWWLPFCCFCFLVFFAINVFVLSMYLSSPFGGLWDWILKTKWHSLTVTLYGQPFVKQFRPMLSDLCVWVCLSCNVGVLWPNG